MMKHSKAKIFGSILIGLAVLWILFTQVEILALPSAVASEAPDRHLSKVETFSRDEAYKLCFALARDIQNRMPMVGLSVFPILLGCWLLTRKEDSCQR